jgi:hypothetical protein
MMPVRCCGRCGQPLEVISSIAADPHDEPVYTCPCWPTEWIDIVAPLLGITILIGFFVLLDVLLEVAR